jgi:hypothetical protein
MNRWDQGFGYIALMGQLLVWLWQGTPAASLALLGWMVYLAYDYHRTRLREDGSHERLVHK